MLTGDDLFAPRVAQDWQEADVLPLSAPAQNARPAPTSAEGTQTTDNHLT